MSARSRRPATDADAREAAEAPPKTGLFAEKTAVLFALADPDGENRRGGGRAGQREISLYRRVRARLPSDSPRAGVPFDFCAAGVSQKRTGKAQKRWNSECKTSPPSVIGRVADGPGSRGRSQVNRQRSSLKEFFLLVEAIYRAGALFSCETVYSPKS